MQFLVWDKITRFLSMGGDQYNNPDNAAAVTDEGQPTPSDEYYSNAPYTKSSGDPETPYTPLYVF